MTENGWEEVGVISVDAGICWVGDACYVFHTDKTPGDIGKDWHGFCAKMSEGCENHRVLDHRQFKHDKGHAGLGVCVGTGHGDGVYPVYIKREGRSIKEVKIVFLED